MTDYRIDAATKEEWAARAFAAEAKLRKSALQELSALVQASEAYQAQLAAEAKLAKAVEALEGLMMHEPDYADTLWKDARATLAELKGPAK
jgi:hypothetical protein